MDKCFEIVDYDGTSKGVMADSVDVFEGALVFYNVDDEIVHIVTSGRWTECFEADAEDFDFAGEEAEVDDFGEDC